MPAAEFSDRPVHVPRTERQGQRDAQAAAQFAVLLQDSGLGLVEIGKDTGAVFIEAPAGLGEIQAPRGPTQQLHAQPLLERGDPAADGRLGDIQAFGGCREAAGLDHGNEGFEIAESAHIVAYIRTMLF
jgi:hypothetical protein